MRPATQTPTKRPYQQPEMNGSVVDTEVLFHTRTMVGLLLDLNRSTHGIRHGMDTLPERLAKVIHHAQGQSRPASKLKDLALFLKVTFPWVIFLTGAVMTVFQPSSLPVLFKLVMHSIVPQ